MCRGLWHGGQADAARGPMGPPVVRGPDSNRRENRAGLRDGGDHDPVRFEVFADPPQELIRPRVVRHFFAADETRRELVDESVKTAMPDVLLDHHVLGCRATISHLGRYFATADGKAVVVTIFRPRCAGCGGSGHGRRALNYCT